VDQPVGSWRAVRTRPVGGRLIAVLIVGWLVLGPTGGAMAQVPDDGTDADGWVTPDGGGVGVDHHGGTGGGPGTGPTSGARPRSCVYYLQDSSSGGIVAGLAVSIAQLRAEALVDTLVWRVCTWTDTSERDLPVLVVVAPNPGRVARATAERAAAELVLPLPIPRTNPSGQTLVNLPTWLWTEQQGVEQRSAAGSGVTATVGAQPVRTTWHPGDGTTLTCDGAGVAYDVTRAADHQSSSCTHTYSTRSGTLDASVTQVWRLVWTATNGESGDLGEVSRTTDFTVDVVELDTVLRTR
jgi:hypothetical protein